MVQNVERPSPIAMICICPMIVITIRNRQRYRLWKKACRFPTLRRTVTPVPNGRLMIPNRSVPWKLTTGRCDTHQYLLSSQTSALICVVTADHTEAPTLVLLFYKPALHSRSRTVLQKKVRLIMSGTLSTRITRHVHIPNGVPHLHRQLTRLGQEGFPAI